MARYQSCLALFTCLALNCEFTPVASARPVRLAIPGYNISQVAFLIAKDKGFYKEEALDVDLIQTTGNLANLALMSGEVEFSSVPVAAIAATSHGANLKIIFSAYKNPLFWAFTKAPVDDVRELRDIKVGVPGFSSVSYYLVSEFLTRQGLKRGRDYTVILAGNSAQRLLALQSSFIDMTILTLPWNFSAREVGMQEVASLVNADIVAPNGSVVVRDALVRSNPILVDQFLRATYKGLRYALERPAGTIAVLARILKLKDDLMTKSYEAARPALTSEGTFSEDSQRKAVGMILKHAGVKEMSAPDRFFNFGLTKKVSVELRGKGWKPAP